MSGASDTIYATSTARGRAGVAIVRVSGPDAHGAAGLVAGGLPRPRQAALRRLRSEDGQVFDEAVVLIFDQGASFTGECVAEFHVHGSMAVVARLLKTLGNIDGLRPAEAGEFTRQALENGRLDLTQVEGLADLIDAETEAQLRQAQRVYGGAISRRYEDWRASLIRAAALLEASIDFADEDVPVDVMPEVRSLLDVVAASWREELEGAAAAERIREGFEVALVGPVNAGKSTLLNAIGRREVALTSPKPGTTRDILELRIDLEGLAVTFIDTAGLREAEEEVERAGVALARRRARMADLRVFLSADRADIGDLFREGDLQVQGKADLGGSGTGLSVSGTTGAGLPQLLAHIAGRLKERVPANRLLIRERQAHALRSALSDVETAIGGIDVGAGGELVAADLRRAILRLDQLVGRVDVEDLLGHIFASFCIGK